jgi:hypothetical protein
MSGKTQAPEDILPTSLFVTEERSKMERTFFVKIGEVVSIGAAL